MNEPRVYKQPVFGVFLAVFMLLFAGAIIFFTLDNFDINILWFLIPILGLFGLIFLSALFSFTSKVIITDDDITSQVLFIPKTLKWGEISHVSGRGNSIKLHNYDGDITVSPNSRIPSYPEIIEIIGEKRPDLFKLTEDNSEMSRGLFSNLFGALVGISLIFLGIFIYFVVDSTDIFPIIMTAIAGVFFLGTSLTAVQKVTLQGNTMLVKYIFSQKEIKAEEIRNIFYGFTQTRRGGKNYFVQISYGNNQNFRISGVNLSLPIAYLVLKNWHKQYIN